MSLPIDRTALIAAQTNQIPNMVLQSALNIGAIQVPYDTIDELNIKVDANHAAGSTGSTQLADGSVIRQKIANGAVGASQLDFALLTDFGDLAVQAEFTRRGVSVLKYGAVGDGIHDDTDAIERGLEYILGLPTGTWETGGDSIAVYGRKSIPLFFPTGIYRTTRPIPIRFMRVSLLGLSDASVGLSSSVIMADHAGDIFALNTNYIVYDFSLKSMTLKKSTTYTGTGNGVSLNGSQWSNGLYLENSAITACNNGLYINNGSSTFASLFITKSYLGLNAGYGLYCTKNITIGEISKNHITQNVTGGIYTGSYGLTICNNDLEGQPSPLTIKHPISPCSAVTIYGNYFEYHLTGVGCIALYNTRKFKVFGNFYSNNNVNIPVLYLYNCSFGEIDDAEGKSIVMNATLNVKRIGNVALTDFETSDVINFSNKSCYVPPSYVTPSLTPNSTFNINGKRYSSYLMDAIARVSVNFLKTYNTGDYVFFSYAVKYTGDIPGSAYGYRPPSVLPQGVRVSDGVTETLSIIGSNLSFASDIQVGDIYINTVCLQATKPYSKMNFYVYPYGNQTTDVGSGAYLVTGIVWTQATNVIPNVNALEVLGDSYNSTISSLPTAGVGYRGIVYSIQGGVGVADISYICRKKSDDTYEWKALFA